MNLKAFLLFSSALLVWILFSKVYMLLYYWGVFVALVAFLNTRPKYKGQPYKWINLVFYLYMLFIVWERTRHFQYSETAELLINDAEHIFFANIISILIALIITLVTNKHQAFVKNILLSVIIFNAVGVINEYFQNLIGHRSFFYLIADSKKDMLMNLLGSVVFLLLAAFFYKTRKLANR
jgi:VanZ family protein